MHDFLLIVYENAYQHPPSSPELKVDNWNDNGIENIDRDDDDDDVDNNNKSDIL
jgi:hypothetical protein